METSEEDLRMVKAMGETLNDWRNLRVLLTGEKDGFKWYIGEFELPFASQGILDPETLKPMASNIVRLAYVDVTGTKLDGIIDTAVIDALGIDLYCGCTFAGAGEMAGLLRKLDDRLQREHWFIGEDYAHNMFGKHESLMTPEKIAEHLETETIPSIMKALVTLDVKDPDFNGQDVQS